MVLLTESDSPTCQAGSYMVFGGEGLEEADLHARRSNVQPIAEIACSGGIVTFRPELDSRV